MFSSANSKAGSTTALDWLRVLLLLRVLAELALGIAWLSIPAGLWSVATQVRVPLEDTGLSPFRLLALGAFAGLVWIVIGIAGVAFGRQRKAFAWLAVLGALMMTVARAWLLGWVPANGWLLGLLLADGGSALALAFLLQAGSSQEDRIGLSTVAEVVSGLRVVLRSAVTWLRHPVIAISGFTVLLVVGLVGWKLWVNLLRAAPEPQFASEEEHFKYAPLGNSRSLGLPLYLWEVLPEVFPEKLPGKDGWASFGFLFEAGRNVPVGLGVRTNGFPMVGFNCALCHTTSYRLDAGSSRQIVPGGPAARLDFNRFLDFLTACAEDPRFTAANLLPRIEARHPLARTEKLAYQHLIIPFVRESLRIARRDFSWTRLRPEAGPGRQDSINILKLNLLRVPDDGSIGTTDYMQVWDQRAEAALLHGWNGSGTGDDANLLAAAFLLNFTPRTFNQAGYDRMVRYLANLAPPSFPGRVDASIAARGQRIFDQHCADCHAAKGTKIGQITPNGELGTDDHYLTTWRPEMVKWLRALSCGPFKFPTLRNSTGFVNLPLTGLWLRGPYLHNGSVPTVEDLLRPPDQRPTSFIRGHDVVDLERLGYVSSGSGAEQDGLPQNNHLLGNANAGHLYGVNLSNEDRRALIEYLKTL